MRAGEISQLWVLGVAKWLSSGNHERHVWPASPIFPATPGERPATGPSTGPGGDWDDPATSLTSEEVDNAVTEQLQERLAAIERAEQRLLDGTYGRSVRSGATIPDERLEADPAADLTADEALEG